MESRKNCELRKLYICDKTCLGITKTKFCQNIVPKKIIQFLPIIFPSYAIFFKICGSTLNRSYLSGLNISAGLNSIHKCKLFNLKVGLIFLKMNKIWSIENCRRKKLSFLKFHSVISLLVEFESIIFLLIS